MCDIRYETSVLDTVEDEDLKMGGQLTIEGIDSHFQRTFSTSNTLFAYIDGLAIEYSTSI